MMTKNSFKSAYASILCLAFLLPLLPIPIAEEPTKDACHAENSTFLIGEKLTYKIYYNWNFVWLPAGEVTFTVSDEGDAYHYQAIGRTYSSYEWFFEVDDQYDSWVSKETLLPVASEKSVREGKYKLYEKVAYNQTTHQATVTRAEQKGMPERESAHEVTNCVHDVLSILYSMRNLDYSKAHVGESKAFSVFLDQEQYNLGMKYLGKETRQKVRGLGRFNTMKFQPQLVAGEVFNEDAKMTVWVADDKNRLPVLIESPVSVGSVKVVLKNYENMKFAVDSKVD